MKAVAEKTRIKTITTHYIDGAFVPSHGQEVMDIVRPTDATVIARVTLGDEEDTWRAIAAARRAFVTFGRTTKEERADTLRRLHHAGSSRIAGLTGAMVEEYGGVVQFAKPIVESAANAFLAAEKALQELPMMQIWGKNDGHPGTGGRGRPHHGLECECPVHLPKLASAVAAGCTVVI